MREESKKSVLLVFPEIPFPARRNGISIRYAPIMELLSERYDLHVVVVVRPGAGGPVGDHSNYCKSFRLYQREAARISLIRRVRTRIATLKPGKVPHGLFCYDKAKIAEFVKESAAARKYDIIVWVTLCYIDVGLEIFGSNKLLVDAIDSEYSLFIRGRNKGILALLEANIVKYWEKNVIENTKAVTYVSPVDANMFTQYENIANKIKVIPNGVYIDDFACGNVRDKQNSNIVIGFIGNMSYVSNIEAVIRLNRLFNRLLCIDPNFELLIIGRDPVDSVKALSENAKVTVTGTVANIWPYVDRVDFFVFPMVSGAGQQNKVMEAMYAKKVVICSPLANSGIGGTQDKHLIQCDSDQHFVESIMYLKLNPSMATQIAEEGHRFVKERFSWERLSLQIEELWMKNGNSDQTTSAQK